MTDSNKNEAAVKTTPTPKETGITRPWQGTFLAVLNIIGLIITAMFIPFALLIVLGGSMLGFADSTNSGLALLIGGGGVVILLMLVALFILGIFIVRGIFKGQKWVIIASLIFSAMSAIQVALNFDIFSALIVALFIYLEIACLLHPFYNKK